MEVILPEDSPVDWFIFLKTGCDWDKQNVIPKKNKTKKILNNFKIV